MARTVHPAFHDCLRAGISGSNILSCAAVTRSLFCIGRETVPSVRSGVRKALDDFIRSDRSNIHKGRIHYQRSKSGICSLLVHDFQHPTTPGCCICRRRTATAGTASASEATTAGIVGWLFHTAISTNLPATFYIYI